MTQISIKDFSCIKECTIEIGKLTVLIGPQASGKSVISKLIYFCNDLFSDIYGSGFDEQIIEIDEFLKSQEEKFTKLFPCSAWGPGGFSIVYSCGPYVISITRKKPRLNSKRIDNVRIDISGELKVSFENYKEELQGIINKATAKNKTHALGVASTFEVVWRARQKAKELLYKNTMGEMVKSQLFIPAGRSFFTNIGRAISAFEQGNFFDSLTIEFGRFFMILREQMWRPNTFWGIKNIAGKKDLSLTKEEVAKNLFSGTIKIEREQEYIETDDGRKIPFSALSSGQQELLPLWLTLNEFMESGNSSCVFLEEPEAHLFPSAQGSLVQYLATLLGQCQNCTMMITTHSPYILGKLNNLITAGNIISQNPKKYTKAVEDIIPKEAILKKGTVKAYAIIEGVVQNIMDDDCTIDGSYLDKISTSMSNEYEELLNVEFPNV